ncbi:MAG: hypothetical protein KDD33_10060 [Bdellovibrionales bacterium]|nr:hypothetical protein [Bdellovibrionales bacterium]
MLKNALKLALFVVFFSVNLWSLSAQSSALYCHQVFKESAAPRSIGYYLDLIGDKGAKVAPKFLDPKEEAELAKQWKGTRQAPELLKETLNDQSALIDFQLLSADAGAVKVAESGNFVSFRLNQEWNGKDMSTNVGLPIDAVVKKTMEKSPYLVNKDAKAVFMFMHGGGTKTTGHHVAAAFSNFMAQYGIIVLSIDAPYHAYGPRVADLHPTDYYRYLKDFRDTFIPKNVPVFLGGHSMGGLHADNVMRLSDKPEFGLREAFAGLINLSGPLDSAPGKSFLEKMRAEEIIDRDHTLQALVPAAERDLSILLLKQGKSSALSGVSAENFMGIVNWQKHPHNGKEYPPTLVVMGERDALYIGREKIFDEHLAQLSNTTIELMGQRKDFHGNDVWVSHMIFDHYRNGTKDLETFNVVKEFIEKQLGEKLGNDNGLFQKDATSSSLGLIARIVKEYYNNLAFRQFASRFELMVKVASDKMAAMGNRSQALYKELKPLQEELKRKQKAKEEGPEVDAIAAKIKELQTELTAIREQQTSAYIPEKGSPLHDFAKANIESRNSLNEQHIELTKEKKTILGQLKSLRQQAKSTQAKVDRIINDKVEIENLDLSVPELKNIKDKFDAMVELQIKMNEANKDMVAKNLEKGVNEVNPGPEMIELYKALDAAYGEYNLAVAQGKKVVEQDILGGKHGQEAKDLMLSLKGSSEQAAPNSILGQIQAFEARVETIDLTNSTLLTQRDQLLADYIQKVTPDLYTIERTTLAQQLDRPMQQVLMDTGKIESLWRIWTEIWKERPPEQGTSLY